MQGNDNNDGNEERNVILPPRNALKLPGIMDKILSGLEFEDVKNARCVSKLWRNHGLTLWRNKLAVFNLNKKSQRALKESLDVNSKSKNKLYLLRERPFKQCKLISEGGYHHFPPARPAGDDSLLFWNHFGPNLTYLDIGNVSMFNKDRCFEGLKWILNSCPNLEELKLCPFRRIKKEDSSQVDEEIQNVVPEDAVTAAAAETVVARKLKYLSIFTAEFTGANSNRYIEVFANDFLLARRFFNLMPNLKGLELDADINSANDVVDGLKRLTLGLLSLEKLYLRSGYRNTDAWLLNYIRELGTAQKLKALCFTECMTSIWNHPSCLKNILKSIRPRVEEFELTVSIPAQLNHENERFRSFDLFRFNFPHLKSLTLKVKTPVREWRTCGTAPELMRHLSFDFSVLRGTPNLEYFFFGCRPISHVPWLTRTLTAADVQGNGGIPNWRLDDNGIERVDEEEAVNNIGIGDGDENIFAPEVGEILLEKMKELHFEGCFSVEALQALGRMMPHLQVLETILDIEPFREVFQIWGGNQGKLKNVKVMLLRRSGEMTTLINRKKREFPKVQIVKAVREENW